MNTFKNIDLIIVGNPEIVILEIFTKANLFEVNNLVCRTKNSIIYTNKNLQPLSETIYPNRESRKLNYKYHIGGHEIDLVRTAVGCNYKCKFCYEYGKDLEKNSTRWQGRSALSIYNEINKIQANFIGFVDDDFTTDMNKIEELCDLLIENKIKKHFICVGRIDHILNSDFRILEKMERAGFIAISMGIESLNENTLKLFRKGLTLEKIENGLAKMNQTNILIACTFLLGSPGESENDMLIILPFSRKWNIDSIGTNRIRMPETSPLYPLVMDSNSKKLKPEFKMIEGEELEKIKFKIKYAQRTPVKILLSFLKLYKHKGMNIDPSFLFLVSLEKMLENSFLDNLIFKFMFKILKNITSNRKFFEFNRKIAKKLFFIVFKVNKGIEFLDSKLNLSTKILPKIFITLNKRIYQVQRDKVQIQ